MNPARPSILTLIVGLFRTLFMRRRGANPYACLLLVLLAGPAFGAATMPTVEEVEEVKVDAGQAKTEAGEAKGDANVALISACVAGALAILAAAGTFANVVWAAYARSKQQTEAARAAAEIEIARAKAAAEIEVAKAHAAGRIEVANVRGAELAEHVSRLSNRVFDLAKAVPPAPSAVVVSSGPPVADPLKVQT